MGAFKAERPIRRCVAAYEAFEFHVIYHAVRNFCVTEMSNFYLDIITTGCTARALTVRPPQRADRYVHYLTLSARSLPILAFTTDDLAVHAPSER